MQRERAPQPRLVAPRIVIRADPGECELRRQARRCQDADRRPLGKRLAIIGIGPRRGRILPVGEARLDLGFDLLWIEIADGDQGRALGPIIIAVEFPQRFGAGLGEELDPADRQPRRRALAMEEQIEAGDRAVAVGAGALPLLGQHDRPFRFERRILERELARRLAHQHQRGIDLGAVGRGDVELVDRLGEIGGGVGIRTHRETEPFQHVQRFAALDMRRSAERHMLQEMRQPQLRLGLVHRSRVDPQADRYPAGRDRAAHHGIAHAVGKDAEQNARAGLDVATILRPGRWLQGHDRARHSRERQNGQCPCRDRHARHPTLISRDIGRLSHAAAGRAISLKEFALAGGKWTGRRDISRHSAECC